MINTKYCTACQTTKNIDAFCLNSKHIRSRCKECLYAYQKLRWRERKREAIGLLGGKCTICGYAKNMAALQFHHVDPVTKLYNWDQMRKMSWTDVLVELKKCILLCANCHAEYHAPAYNEELMNQTEINSFIKHGSIHTCRKDERIRNYKKRVKKIKLEPVLKPTGNCLICQKETYNTKYCSYECAKFSRRVVERPIKEILEKLVWEKPTLEIAKIYDVSDKAIEKWCKYYNINKPPRGYWAKLRSMQKQQ